jgi:hypothetical protein
MSTLDILDQNGSKVRWIGQNILCYYAENSNELSESFITRAITRLF